ncbi:type IV pilin N-terminal domain-containing protein [Haloplanus halobius]|uniref:type IV pilin N-terminal domain-containing protein n=1 Tax=Haloplanus halobius TaxID=2934938 RepID=UPI00200E7790
MSRAQSEVVGSLLVLVTVVFLVSVVGYYALSDIAVDDGPTADITGDVRAESVTFTHRGGDPIPGDELTVILRYDGTGQRYDFATAGSYGNDSVFDPGETWTLDGSVPYDTGDQVELRLVHEPSGTTLVRGRGTAVTPTPTPTPAPASVRATVSRA